MRSFILIAFHKIEVFTTTQINQQKTRLLDLILIASKVNPQPLLNNIGGGFLLGVNLGGEC
jgi:hypothetical protein